MSDRKYVLASAAVAAPMLVAFDYELLFGSLIAYSKTGDTNVVFIAGAVTFLFVGLYAGALFTTRPRMRG